MLSKLSPRSELILINLICFGPFAAMAIVGLAAHRPVMLYDDRRLYTYAAIELVCGALAIAILRARGWTRADLGLKVSMPLTIFGMLLFIGANITLAGFYEAFRAISGTDPGASVEFVARASWPAIVVLLAIDPLYEETFEVAYNIKATENSGAMFGITLSAVIRFICHLEQGPLSALTILPLGLIFAAVYWRWRRVWPLTVAHGVASYFSLAPQ